MKKKYSRILKKFKWLYIISFLIIICIILILFFLNQKKSSLYKDVPYIELSDTVNSISFNLIFVKGGTFKMGCNSWFGCDCDGNEKPVHDVTLNDYYIGKYEITQELWETVMGSNPSYYVGKNKPVEHFSMEEIQIFIMKLNILTNKKYRLPTEAEWEYAARGGVKSKNYKYSGNDQIKKIAWFLDNSLGKGTNIVGSMQHNEIGIYDMSGNVWEWCQDYSGDYFKGHQMNPKGAKWGLDFIIRGGSFATDKTECRVSNRNHCSSDNPGFYGFRIVLSEF